MLMNKTLTRTICCKLDVDGHETLLAATQRAFNMAASWVAQVCWNEGITNTNTAHHRVYGETRLNFGLGAQLAVCARAKAVEAIKSVKAKHAKKRETEQTCPTFGPHGSIRYDARTYRLMSLDRVSLNTLDGRVVCRLVLGSRQHELLVDPAWTIGGADLVWRKGVYYLHITQSCETADETPESVAAVQDVLGVDLGIVQVASDSDGDTFSGEHVKKVRARYVKRRQQLQKVGTKNAKRRLRKNAGKERRFQQDVNHRISKALVKKAVVSRKALALEDLTGIRERVTVRREYRYARHSWAFLQLRTFLAYKAAWAGVSLVLVDPRNTSRTCSRCGHCEQANRKSQAEFLCRQCGYAVNADFNAAVNIARLGRIALEVELAKAEQYWAAVNQPLASPHQG